MKKATAKKTTTKTAPPPQPASGTSVPALRDVRVVRPFRFRHRPVSSGTRLAVTEAEYQRHRHHLA